jgi:hypothetical protein
MNCDGIEHDPAVAKFSAYRRALYQKLLPLMAENPWITNVELAVDIKVSPGVVVKVSPFARSTLSIIVGRGSAPNVISDRARYEKVCSMLGVEPVAENEGPTRLPCTAGFRNGGDRGPNGRIRTPVPRERAKTEVSLMRLIRPLVAAIRAEGVEEVAIHSNGSVFIRFPDEEEK